MIICRVDFVPLFLFLPNEQPPPGPQHHNVFQRTVKELHGNLLGEVNTITSEFRRVYNTAKQRAEDHANEGWSSESMQSRIMLENRELKEAIINQNIRAKEMYSELERRLKENDKSRQRELAAAHKAAHDAKAGEFRVVFK